MGKWQVLEWVGNHEVHIPRLRYTAEGWREGGIRYTAEGWREGSIRYTAEGWREGGIRYTAEGWREGCEVHS